MNGNRERMPSIVPREAMWCAVHQNGRLWLHSIAASAKEAMSKAAADDVIWQSTPKKDRSWKRLHAAGWRVVKVLVVPYA